MTNDYLFGQAGYNVSDKNYMVIPLEEFIKNNSNCLENIIVPNYAGDIIFDNGCVTLKELIVSKFNEQLKK